MSRADAALVATDRVSDGGASTIDLLGSGTRISANTILTSAHVLNDHDDGYLVRVEGDRRSGGRLVSASVVWRDDDLDVAVLRTASSALDDRSPLAWKVGVEQSTSSIRWECSGYPMVRADTPSEVVEQISGTACSCAPGDEHLNLDAPVWPGQWGGISGGGVWFGDRLGGVMRAVPSGWEGGRIQAVPVARFLRLPKFRKAAGLPLAEVETRHIEQWLSGLLSKVPILTRAITDRFEAAPPEAAPMAQFLLEQRVADLAVCFDHVDEALEDTHHTKERDVLANIVARLLPYAADIRQFIVDAGAVPEASLHTLPIKSATWAELIVAGLDKRHAFFKPVPKGLEPPGVSAIIARLFPAANLPLIDIDGGRAALEIMHHIAEEHDLKDPDDLAEEVGIFLRSQRRDRTPKAPPPHYLLLDHQYGDTWAVIFNAVSTLLPDLCVVHLAKVSKSPYREEEMRTGMALTSTLARQKQKH